MEDIKPLRLKSPCGQGYISFNWDESINNKLPSDSIMETIRWVCKEVPVLKSIIDIKVIRQIDRSNYADMQALCDRFNHVIDTFLSMSKGTSMVCGNPIASHDLLKWILEFVYTRVVSQPVLLNKCKANALPETYGETNYEQVRKIIQKLNMQPDDTFIDLGSGIGHIVLQVAASTQCRQSIGIEKESTRAEYAVEMDKEFKGLMKWFGKKFHNYQLINGDFLDAQHHEAIYQSTVIFVNNFAFREVNHKLKSLFANLDNNTRIISTYPFRSESFRVSDRNLDDTAAMMKVSKFLSEPGAFSWTPNPVPYYIQTIDRCVLQEYFDNKHINNEQKKSRHKLLNGLDNASNSGDTMDSISETSSQKSFKTEPSHSNESAGSRFKHLNHHPPSLKQPQSGGNSNTTAVAPTLFNNVNKSEGATKAPPHNANHHRQEAGAKKRFKTTTALPPPAPFSTKAREELPGLGKKKGLHNNSMGKQPAKTNGGAGGTQEKRRIAPLKQSHPRPSSFSGEEEDLVRPVAKKRAHSPVAAKKIRAASIGDRNSGSGSSSSISLFSSPYAERKIEGPFRNDTASPDLTPKLKKHPTSISGVTPTALTAKGVVSKSQNNGPSRRLSTPLLTNHDANQGPQDMEMDEEVNFIGLGNNSLSKKSPKSLPTVLPQQTRVSVKGKGGTSCQAIITKVEPRLKVRVRLPEPVNKSVIVNHTAVLQGCLEVGSVVKVEQDMKIRKGTIEKIWDNSVYTIEMEEGEVRVVRRSMIHVVQLAMRNYSKQNRTFGPSTLDKLKDSLYTPTPAPLPRLGVVGKPKAGVAGASGKVQLYTSSSSSSSSTHSGSSSSSTLSSPNASRSSSRSRSSSASSLPSGKSRSSASVSRPETTVNKKRVRTAKDGNSNFKGALGSEFASSLDLLHQHTVRSVNAPLQHTQSTRDKKTRKDLSDTLTDSIVIPRPEGMDTALFTALSSGISNVFQQWCKLYAAISALRQNNHQKLEDELIIERVKGQQMNTKIALAEASKREMIADISALLQARMNKLDSSIVKPLNLSRFAKEVVNHQQNLKSTIIKIESEVDVLAQKNVEMREKLFALTGKDYYDPAGASGNPLQFYTEQIVNKLLHSSNSTLLRPQAPFLPTNFKAAAGPAQGLVNSGNLLFNNSNSAGGGNNMYLASAVKLMSAAAPPNFNVSPGGAPKKPYVIQPPPHHHSHPLLDNFNQQLSLVHSTTKHLNSSSPTTLHKNKLHPQALPLLPSSWNSVLPKPTPGAAQPRMVSCSNAMLASQALSGTAAPPQQIVSKHHLAPQQQQQLISSDLADPLACASYVKKVIAKAMEESQAAASCTTTQHGGNHVNTAATSGNCPLSLPLTSNSSHAGIVNSVVGTSLKLAPGTASIALTSGPSKPNNLITKISSNAAIAHNLPATLKFTNSAAHQGPPHTNAASSGGLNSAQLLSNSWGLSAFIHQTTASTVSTTLSHPIKTTQQSTSVQPEVVSTPATSHIVSGIGPGDATPIISHPTTKGGEEAHKLVSSHGVKSSPPSATPSLFNFVSQPTPSQPIISQSADGDASKAAECSVVSSKNVLNVELSSANGVTTSPSIKNSNDGTSSAISAKIPSTVPEILVEFPIASITHETVACSTNAAINSNSNSSLTPDQPPHQHHTSPPVAYEQSDSHKSDKSEAHKSSNNGERFFKRSNKESRPSHKLNASSTLFKYNASVASTLPATTASPNGKTPTLITLPSTGGNSVFDSTFNTITSPTDGYQPVVMEDRSGPVDTANIELMASVALIAATSSQFHSHKGHSHEDKPTTTQLISIPTDDNNNSSKQQFVLPNATTGPDKIVLETVDKIPTTPTPSISSSSDVQSADHVKGDWEKPLKKRSTNPTLPELQQGAAAAVGGDGLVTSRYHHHQPLQHQHHLNAWYQQLLKLEQGAPSTTNAPLQPIPHNFPFLPPPNNHHAHPYAPLSGERFGHHFAALSQYNAMLKAAHHHQPSTTDLDQVAARMQPPANYLYRPAAVSQDHHNHYHPAITTTNNVSYYPTIDGSSHSSHNNLVPHDDNSALHPSFLHQPPTYFDSYAGGRLIGSGGSHHQQQPPHSLSLSHPATPSFKPYDNNATPNNVPSFTTPTTPNHSSAAAAMMLINEYSQAQSLQQQLPTPSQVAAAAAAYNYFPYLVQHGFHPHHPHPYFGHMMSSGPTAPTHPHHPHPQMSSWLSAVMAAGNTSPLSDLHHPPKGKQSTSSSGFDLDLKSVAPTTTTTKTTSSSILPPSMQPHPAFLTPGHRNSLPFINSAEESFHHNVGGGPNGGRQSMPHNNNHAIGNFSTTLITPNNRKFGGAGVVESGPGPGGSSSSDKMPVAARASSVNLAAISGGGVKPLHHINNPLFLPNHHQHLHHQGSSSVNLSGHQSSPLALYQPPYDLRVAHGSSVADTVSSLGFAGPKQLYCHNLTSLYGGPAIDNGAHATSSTTSHTPHQQPSPPPFNIPRMMTNPIPLNYGSLDKK